MLGPRLGKDVQRVIKAAQTGDWSNDDGTVTAGGVALEHGEYELAMVAVDAEHTAALPNGAGVIVLDTELTHELAAEGMARDLARLIQQARKDADLDVSDRVSVVVDAVGEVQAAIEAHRGFVQAETLALELTFGALGDEATNGEAGEATVKAAVTKR